MLGVLNAFNLLNSYSATEAKEKSDAHFAKQFATKIDKEKLQHE